MAAPPPPHPHIVGVVGSLSFDAQGRGVPPNSDPFGHAEKGGGGGAKIGYFHGCHKCMVPKRFFYMTKILGTKI